MLAILLGMLACLTAAESNGQFDPGFHGGTARVIAFAGTGPGAARFAERDATGRVVVAGWTTSGSDVDVVCARFLGDGTPDATFGTDGWVRVAPTPDDDHLAGLALLGERVLLVTDGTDGISVVALAADGTRITEFAGSGRLVLPKPTDMVGAAAIACGGRVIIAGSRVSSDEHIADLVAVTPMGAIDPAWGEDGRLVIGMDDPLCIPLLLAADDTAGLAVIAGASSKRLTVARLDPGGQPVAAFGIDGVYSHPVLGFVHPTPLAATLAPTGEVTMAVLIPVIDGLAWTGNESCLMRLTAAGVLDGAFGVEGIQPLAVPMDHAADLRPAVGGGWFLADGESDGGIRLRRLLADGTADPAFGTPATTADGLTSTFGPRVLGRDDGGVIVIGGADTVALRAFAGDGSVLPGSTPASIAPGAPDDRAPAALAQPGCAVLLAGTSGGRPALVRLTADGADDAAFAAGGRLVVDAGGDAGITAIAALPGGGWMVAGHAAGDLLLGRLQADGMPDPSFGTDGWLIRADAGGGAVDLAVRPDGRLIVVTDAPRGYLADGSPDAGFATAGIASLPDFEGTQVRLTRCVLLGDGRLLVAGGYFRSGHFGFVLRYTEAGVLDPAWHGSGAALVAPTPIDIAPAGDRTLVLAGDGAVITAFGSSGGTAAGFGDDGTASLPFVAQAFDRAADGTVCIAGYDPTLGRACVARLSSDGDPDPSFPPTVLPPVLRGVTACAFTVDGAALDVVGVVGGDIIIVRIRVDATAPAPATAAPTFTPGAGSYASIQQVVMASGTPGAVIRYTTDGSVPTLSSTLHTLPVWVTGSDTITAVAIAPGHSPSPPTSATYVIQSTGGGGGGGTTPPASSGGSGGGCGAGSALALLAALTHLALIGARRRS